MQSRSRWYLAALLQTALLLSTMTSARGQRLWTPTGSLNQPRFQTTGTLLKDGRVSWAGASPATRVLQLSHGRGV